ncbi:hypothetical protein ENSA5_01820 [Enhygromyxa salina]|uniref:Lipoprotein n=1 Tax=Enhygromyxa salina TaxID=215803 RepID=A0A2S9YLD8_9BACT|nr:hypothetical protein [Enhygromyxa salina]PRQ05862.1 hypothetical protein ENSA5_01820 [Enhygromyxa salina]
MHVDRSRFLFLTASLAAAACNQPRPATGPDTGDAEPARSGDRSSDSAEQGEPEPGDPAVWLEIEPGTEDGQAATKGADCDNSAGRPGGCTLSPPGSHCESFQSTMQVCDSFSRFMQPRAAEAAVACLQAASGTRQICDLRIWDQCTSAGLQATCIEAETQSKCNVISDTCGGSLSRFTCQQALSAVQPQHIRRLANCVEEHCEVSFCVTDLSWI